MAKAVSAIVAGLLLAGAHAHAGETGCGAATMESSPFYCQLEQIDAVSLRLDGTAAALGANSRDLEQIMREKLERFLAVLPGRTAGATRRVSYGPPQQGQFACTLWTVGRKASIALFVECALQSEATGDSVDARLLGRTNAAEFDLATRVALGRVITKVTARFNAQRDRLVALSAITRDVRTKTAGPSQ